MTEAKLKKLFEEVRVETRNFTTFNPEVLMENPNRLIIFRLTLCLSLKQFGKIIGRHHDGISQHERKDNTKIRRDTAEHFMQVIEKKFGEKNLIGNVQPKDVISTFRKFRNMLKGGFISTIQIDKLNKLPIEVRMKWMQKGAINSFSKRRLTEMENKVFEKLRKHGFKVSKHFLVGVNEIDLALWKENKLWCLIEVVGESFSPLKILDAKKKVNVPIIGVATKERKMDIIAFLKTFDIVIFDDNLQELINVLQNDTIKIKLNQSSFQVTNISRVSRLNEFEKIFSSELEKHFKDNFESQVKFEFSFEDLILSKRVDFVIPNILQNKCEPLIFIEIKHTKKPDWAICRASTESITLKTLFPNTKFLTLIFPKTKLNHSFTKIRLLPLKEVGIDEVLFSIEDTIEKIKNGAPREIFEVI